MSAPVAVPFHELAMLADMIAAELYLQLPAIPRDLVRRAARSVASGLIQDGHVSLVVNGRALAQPQPQGAR